VKALKLPLIVTLHGYDVTVSDAEFSRSPTGRLYLRRRRDLWDQAAAFLCDSDFLRARAVKLGFPEYKLRTHYIGVDHNAFQRSADRSDSTSVVFVGRLVEKKGCDVLVRAMSIVQRQFPLALLTVVGDGYLRRPLEDLAKRLNVNCSFLGPLSSAQVRQTLQNATIFCAPSRTAENGDSEGFGIVFIEAQAMGVPVVSSLHGGIPEAVIHGQTGLLAPEGDHETLAQHLMALLAREDMRFLYGSRGIQLVKNRFDIHARTQALEDTYAEFAATRGATARLCTAV
jgi:colanic acid/amylovoran biosynthesis glycosyltransferase